MATYSDRFEINAPGAWYVDESCIDCDQCRQHVPEFFVRNDREAHTYVIRQPVTEEEIAACEDARDGCPTDSIGNDGSADTDVPKNRCQPAGFVQE